MDIEFDFKGDPVGGVITKCKLILFTSKWMHCTLVFVFIGLCSPLYIATVVANPGCKESQFYSLPFGQVVASMY